MIELNKFLTRFQFSEIVLKKEAISVHNSLQNRVEDSFQFLSDFSKNKVIYGVNTGFGPMAQYRVSDEQTKQLQFNLIRSHASGAGKVMPIEFIRATMLARLNSICQAKSGVHISVINTLIALINQEIYPVIFEHGGVGASGDLVQLSHLALALIGEGEVIYKGERQATAKVFAECSIEPIQISIREGISLINGTSAMTGIGLLNLHHLNQLLNWSIACSSMMNELVEAYDDHISEELNGAKLHKGQMHIATQMRSHLCDSKRMRKRNEHLYSGTNQETIFKEKVQEYYSIRCIPQILGPICDSIIYAGEVLENELNSANDNPIIDFERAHVYHGGNFHGDYISLEMDKMKLTATRLCMLAERQLNYLLNAKINEILPPFVNRGTLGLNYGMQGAQFTATSTTAENQTLSTSMYIHSIPCNNDNQDIVSMGTNAAQLTARVIENTFEVLSIELITLFQAIRYTAQEENFSSKTQKIIQSLATIIPDFTEDQAIYPIIEKVKQHLIQN
jgi:histidine ammonia-lyase